MLITEQIDTVVLHMQKTAGHSIGQGILAAYPKFRWLCHHAPISLLPEEYKNFKRIGFCRNPLYWYVSRYYYSKQETSHTKKMYSLTQLLSNNFQRNFKTTLPLLLDMQNFFDMNPQKLAEFKNIIRNEMINGKTTRIITLFPNIENIKPEDFNNTLYQYLYIQAGLPSATVYKMDDGNLEKYVKKEFPNVRLSHINKGPLKDLKEEYTSSLAQQVVDADQKIFHLHNYNMLKLD